MIDNLMWLIAGLAIVGVILNIHKKRSGFIIWIITNFANCLYCFHKTAYPQSALFAVYFLLAIWGVVKWRKPKQPKPTDRQEIADEVHDC